MAQYGVRVHCCLHSYLWDYISCIQKDPYVVCALALRSVAGSCCRCTLSPTPALTAEQRDDIDGIAHKVLETTGVPSASLAVVKDGKIVYAQAYGDARLEPKLPATTQMAYSIGSISKQFTAAAVLMLQQQGKLSLDDKVSKWLPDLTRANDITLRQVLSMTSGYQDYAPQDYMIPDWEKADLGAADSRSLGAHSARLRAGNEVAVQQHELRRRGSTSSRRSRASRCSTFITPTHSDAAEHEQRARHQCQEAAGERSPGILPLCAWAVASGSARRTRMDVCCRRAGDDAERSGEVGHLADE